MINARSPGFAQQLTNLRIFLCVADSGSIARAAQRLRKVPAAITHSIQDLEQAVGVSLFQRRASGMTLTASGEALLVRARRIDEEVQCAIGELRNSPVAANAPSTGTTSALLFSHQRLALVVHLEALRSIRAAAAPVGVTRSRASTALANMELALGRRLFRRGGGGLVPLPRAEKLTMRSKRIFAELRHIECDLSAIAGSLTGSVVVGTTPLGGAEILPHAIIAVLERHPRLRVIAVERSFDQLNAGLSSGEVDIVIGAVGDPHRQQRLIVEPLFIDRLAVIARADHALLRYKALKLSKLRRERWILPSARARELIEASFRAVGLRPPVPAIEASDPAMIRQLLCVSDLLAVSSPRKLMFELQAGVLVELPVTLEGTIWEVGLIVREGVMLSPAARALLDAVRAQARTRRGEP